MQRHQGPITVCQTRRKVVQCMSRASASLLAAYCCPGLSVLPISPALADAPTMPFTLFDEMQFQKKPNLTHYGLKEVLIAYAPQLWPNLQKGLEPDPDHILNQYVTKRARPKDNMFCLDVEHWSLRDKDERVVQESIRKLKVILSVFRSAWPGISIGVFAVGPQSTGSFRRDLVTGRASKKDYATYQVINDRLQPLFADVDIFFPCIYTKWPDNLSGWERFARTTIETARTYANGKPVIPFIWPQFWLPGEALIPGLYWRRILDTVYELADSAIIWSIYQTAPRWDPRWPWWHETVDFLRTHNRSLR